MFHFQKTLQKYCSGKQVKEGWVLSVPYDAKHGVGTPYLKPAEGSSSSKGNRTIKRYRWFSLSHNEKINRKLFSC